MKKDLQDFRSIEIKSSHSVSIVGGSAHEDEEDDTGGNGTSRPKGGSGTS